MSGIEQPAVKLSEEFVTRHELGTACPECSSRNTVLLVIGDPSGPSEVLEESPGVMITKLSGCVIAQCNDCETGWEVDSSKS